MSGSRLHSWFNGYRYGFNGKEQDPEWNGGGNMYDYGFRIYDPRIAKFLSVDPLFKSFPWYTPYQFAGNKPIWAIDLDGLEEMIRNAPEELTVEQWELFRWDKDFVAFVQFEGRFGLGITGGFALGVAFSTEREAALYYNLGGGFGLIEAAVLSFSAGAATSDNIGEFEGDGANVGVLATAGMVEGFNGSLEVNILPLTNQERDIDSDLNIGLTVGLPGTPVVGEGYGVYADVYSHTGILAYYDFNDLLNMSEDYIALAEYFFDDDQMEEFYKKQDLFEEFLIEFQSLGDKTAGETIEYVLNKFNLNGSFDNIIEQVTDVEFGPQPKKTSDMCWVCGLQNE
ncbi:MAG: RHS repeat domain-containing protein [Bacteroidia bacterium]